MNAKKFQIHIFVKTGTYLGDMLLSTKNTFKQIFFVEIDKDLYEWAKKKFQV